MVNLENVERLLALVGVAVAKEVLMTARMFTGEEAKDVGLVTANVPQDELESAVASFATELAALAPWPCRAQRLRCSSSRAPAQRGPGIRRVLLESTRWLPRRTPAKTCPRGFGRWRTRGLPASNAASDRAL